MNWKWRALIGTILLVGTVIWLPMAVSTSAQTRYNTSSTVVRGPASDNDTGDNDAEDNDSSDNGSSDNGSADNNNNNDNSSGNRNNNDNSSGNSNNNDNSSGNSNNNDNSSDLVNNQTSPPPNTGTSPNPNDLTGAHKQNGNLSIDLGRTADKPVVNMPFQITITGNGAPIAQLSWWADGGGGNAGPNNDDLAHVGTSTFPCNSGQPCSSSWTIVARNVGYYTIHAQVQDTSGNVVQTDWNFLVSENARN